MLGIKEQSIGKLIDIDSKQEKHLASAYYDNTFENEAHLHFDGNYIHTWYTDNNLTQTRERGAPALRRQLHPHMVHR